MSRRTTYIVMTVLLLVLIAVITWITYMVNRLEKISSSRKKVPAATSAP